MPMNLPPFTSFFARRSETFTFFWLLEPDYFTLFFSDMIDSAMAPSVPGDLPSAGRAAPRRLQPNEVRPWTVAEPR